MCADIVSGYKWGGGMVLACGGPEMLLSILQCLGQSPQTKNYPAQNVNSTKVETHCSGQSWAPKSL